MKLAKNISAVSLALLTLLMLGCGDKDKKAAQSNKQQQASNQNKPAPGDDSSPIDKKALPAGGEKELKSLLKENQANVVFVHAKWCPVCRKYKPIFQEVMQNKFPDINPIYVDAQEKANLTKALKLKSVPKMYLFDKKGNFIESIGGSIPKKALEAELEKLKS